MTASEVGSFAYCSRQYWLARVQEVSPEGDGEALRAGIRNHHRHGVRYDWQLRLWRIGQWSALVAILAIAAALLLFARGGV